MAGGSYIGSSDTVEQQVVASILSNNHRCTIADNGELSFACILFLWTKTHIQWKTGASVPRIWSTLREYPHEPPPSQQDNKPPVQI